jgi:hypothetical protein
MSVVDVERGFRALLLARTPTLLPGLPEARQHIYRRLVRGNLLGTLARACPHAKRLAPTTFDALAERFLDESPPTTRFVRDVPAQFTQWALQHVSAEVPLALVELMHFEALEIEIALSEVSLARSARLDDTRPLALCPSLRLGVYVHAVHTVTRSSTSLPPSPPPGAQPTVLVCFQEAEEFVALPSSTAVAKVIVGCASGQTLGAALRGVVNEAAGAGVDVAVGRVRAALVELVRRGALS